ncbi:Ubiquitin carboxyl-terminal hydrolase 6 [Dichanthelium oligosanthes]|uniref:Ubiquitin carboxyl-terminal hydrolase n=1 Tax=Dichanthelium oligosanthes TaxID=888268 RepID=A0A1E5VPD2_9POAL|nr:Ubiquitin carboxyl-terminal hydrolase 6 [Dichanthelium oligosanthes]
MHKHPSLPVHFLSPVLPPFLSPPASPVSTAPHHSAAAMPTVSVKWQKEVFPGIEIDTSQPPLVFKSQLYTLTGVPPERQKIMVKGGILKDDADWSTLGVKDGQKLMMIGTADEIVKAPEKGPVFVEDLPEEEQVVALGHSAGLYNLGNTCYMNSTLQCLHSVPELKSALLSYSDTARGNGIDQASHNLTLATRNTFGELDQSVRPIAPLQFLQFFFKSDSEQTLRKKYPQFAQQHNNVYMQQDAEECWTQLVYTLSQTLTSDASESAVLSMKQLFGIDLVSRVHCAETGEESMETESVYSLKCHISQDVNHLHEGLKHVLDCPVCSFLLEKGIKPKGKDFTMFYCQKVDYPLELDVYEFCSDELKQKLQAPRQMLRDAENAKFGLKTQGKASSSKENEGSSSNTGESSSMDIDKGKWFVLTGFKLILLVCVLNAADPSVPKKQLTGVYDLVAVLTHKGRSADSGHYVGWVKQDDGKWIEYDDDNPNIRKEEDILKLSGGGDWHMAYICMYKARMAESKS